MWYTVGDGDLSAFAVLGFSFCPNISHFPYCTANHSLNHELIYEYTVTSAFFHFPGTFHLRCIYRVSHIMMISHKPLKG